jgi:ribosomal protein L31
LKGKVVLLLSTTQITFHLLNLHKLSFIKLDIANSQHKFYKGVTKQTPSKTKQTIAPLHGKQAHNTNNRTAR